MRVQKTPKKRDLSAVSSGNHPLKEENNREESSNLVGDCGYHLKM